MTGMSPAGTLTHEALTEGGRGGNGLFTQVNPAAGGWGGWVPVLQRPWTVQL